MAGANGILKFARTDREGYLDPLLYRGTPFQMVDPLPVGVLASPIPNASILSDILLLPATPSPLVISGTAADVGGLLATMSLNQVGSKWEIIIQNSDPVNPKVITLPAGFNPASITVPANGYYLYTWEVLSTAPQSIQLITELPGTGGGAAVTTFNGRPGPVILPAAGDYSSTMVTNLSTVPGADVTTALNNLSAASGVSSFNARTGAVVPVAGDYTSTLVTNLSTVPGADVTTALNNLQAASGVSSFNARTGAVVPVAGDYTAAMITYTPGGNVQATDTNVQLAISRLATSPYVRADYPATLGVAANWVSSLAPIIVRSRGAWAVAGSQIADNNTLSAGEFLVNVSLFAESTLAVPAGAGSFGLRLLVNGVAVPLMQTIAPDDGTGLIQRVSTSMQMFTNPGDTFQAQIMDNTTVVGQAFAVIMIIHHVLGQSP